MILDHTEFRRAGWWINMWCNHTVFPDNNHTMFRYCSQAKKSQNLLVFDVIRHFAELLNIDVVVW